MKSAENRSAARKFDQKLNPKKAPAIASSSLSLAHHLISRRSRTVILIPSPHGEYKSGISSNDALAAGEIYAHLRKIRHVDVTTPEFLGCDIAANLILIGGKKANPIAKNFARHCQANLRFDLDDGVIYDKERQVVLTPEYMTGKKRTTANVNADHGLIVYSDNPFGSSTKILHLAGIKGFGTLAAAFAIVDSNPSHEIDKVLTGLTRNRDDTQVENETVEILVRASVDNGRARRESVSIEKVRVSRGSADRTWQSARYNQLSAAVPHKLYITTTKQPGNAQASSARIDDQEVKYDKSVDRMNAIYWLAKKAREDYLENSPTEGWVSASELAERLWQIKMTNGMVQISDGIRTEMAKAIARWARHLTRSGKLILSEDVKLDSDYINSEILSPELDIKKKIVDLVHKINQDEKGKRASGIPLIESRPGLGYRINFHPALIFITEIDSTS